MRRCCSTCAAPAGPAARSAISARRTIADICEAIDWLAAQPWCDGNVGMFGASYFSLVAGLVAAQKPKILKCIFAPFAWSDAYRDRYYQGGILNYGFSKIWFETLPETTFEPGLRETWGDERFEQALAAALEDAELAAVPFLANVLRNPDVGRPPRAAGDAAASVRRRLLSRALGELRQQAGRSRLFRRLLGRLRHASARRVPQLRELARADQAHDRPAALSRPAALPIRLRVAALVRSLAQGQRHRR